DRNDAFLTPGGVSRIVPCRPAATLLREQRRCILHIATLEVHSHACAAPLLDQSDYCTLGPPVGASHLVRADFYRLQLQSVPLGRKSEVAFGLDRAACDLRPSTDV